MNNNIHEPLFPFLLKENCDHSSFYINNSAISNTKFLNDIYSTKSSLDFLSCQKTALCFQDSYLFSVSFFACLLADITPVLLPNNQQGTLKSLEQEFDNILNDDSVIELLENEHNESKFRKLSIDQAVILFTSGSTGKPKKITRTLHQLINEIEVLDKTFYKNKNSREVYSTVTHQHIYGLLFFILWPLRKQYRIHLPIINYPEQLEDIEKINNLPVTIISSPALLKRLDDNAKNTSISTIFSSGGILNKKAAQSVRHIFNINPIEVFGSTETGGIAYREQIKSEAWKLFDRVNITVDNITDRSQINSPFFTDGKTYICLDDKIEFDSYNCTFKLLGRFDNVVKIEEKRISLMEMETRIKQHHFVDDCKVVPLHDKRQYIGAVIELNKIGQASLRKSSKLKVNQAIQNYLKSYYDKILIPKKFRYVDHIPVNSQGKTILSEINILFE